MYLLLFGLVAMALFAGVLASLPQLKLLEEPWFWTVALGRPIEMGEPAKWVVEGLPVTAELERHQALLVEVGTALPFAIRRRTLLDTSGDRYVSTGDVEFDSLVGLVGPPHVICACLEPSVRRALVELTALGASHEFRKWSLLAHRGMDVPGIVLKLVRVSTTIADTDPLHGLRRQATTDPSAGVRERAALLLLPLLFTSGTTPAPDLLEALDREIESDAFRVAVAERRGPAGRERLRELSRHPLPTIRTTAALGLAALREPDAEELLLAVLSHGELEVIHALGRLASVRAVAPLLALVQARPELSVDATTAVRTIQARSVGAAKGHLSLSESEGGDVSEVRATGAVSLKQ